MIKRLGGNPHLSHAVIHNNVVYLSGQVPDDAMADMPAQTKQVLDKIDKLLAATGASRSTLLSVTIWLKNISDRDQLNAMWIPWIGDDKCARACVQAELANPKYLIEIAAIAACDTSSI
jgi:enamine deaminase RidA (YjgF/YER057c/UK114 family)